MIYEGYVSWGEYPMNFAAVLNQEEIYRCQKRGRNHFIEETFLRLILAKGGNFDLQDTNGCTVTHIMVVFDNINVGTLIRKESEEKRFLFRCLTWQLSVEQQST